MGSFFEDFAKIFPEQQNSKGPLKPWEGAKIHKPDKSVMDEPVKPQLTAYEKREKEQAFEGAGLPTIGVGDLQFGISDFYTPGGLSKLAAAAGAKLAATPVMVAAFRSANNTMLSREYQSHLKKGIKNLKDDIEYVGEANPVGAGLAQVLVDKVSDREISKYGTPEFLIDKWLHSTNQYGTRVPNGVEEVSRKQLLDETTNVMRWNTIKAELIKALPNTPEADRALHESVIAKADKSILKHEGTKLAEDFFLAEKQGKKLLLSQDTFYPAEDMQAGLQSLTNSLQRHGLTAPDIEGKSLQQIASIVHRKDDEAVRILKKSMEAKTQIISKRTAELFNSQRDPDLGMFVKLQDGKDLAHETDILNHCIGAVGRDNNKYLPAYDTVTGKERLFTDPVGGTSYMNYAKKLREGTSEFYSYRPKGSPEFTVEILGVDSGYPRLGQAYGFEDAPLTAVQKVELKKMLDNKRISYHENAFGDLNEPVAAGNANANNFLQALGQQHEVPPEGVGPFWLP